MSLPRFSQVQLQRRDANDQLRHLPRCHPHRLPGKAPGLLPAHSARGVQGGQLPVAPQSLCTAQTASPSDRADQGSGTQHGQVLTPCDGIPGEPSCPAAGRLLASADLSAPDLEPELSLVLGSRTARHQLLPHFSPCLGDACPTAGDGDLLEHLLVSRLCTPRTGLTDTTVPSISVHRTPWSWQLLIVKLTSGRRIRRDSLQSLLSVCLKRPIITFRLFQIKS